MKKFAEYAQTKCLAEFFVENEIDVEKFCDKVLYLAQNDKLDEDNLLEFWGGIPGMARNVMGKFGGLGALGGAAARGIGNAASAVGGAVGNAAGAVGRGIGNAASAVGNTALNAGKAVTGAVGNAASAVGGAVGNAAKGVANTYTQGRDAAVKAQAVKQVQDRLQALYGDLAGTGLDKATVQQLLAPIQKQIQQAQAQQAQAPAQQVG